MFRLLNTNNKSCLHSQVAQQLEADLLLFEVAPMTEPDDWPL